MNQNQSIINPLRSFSHQLLDVVLPFLKSLSTLLYCVLDVLIDVFFVLLQEGVDHVLEDFLGHRRIWVQEGYSRADPEDYIKEGRE